MDLKQKRQFILTRLRDKAVFLGEAVFDILVRDLTTDDVTIFDALSVLERLQKDHAIEIKGICVASNANQVSMFHFPNFFRTEYNFNKLGKNNIERTHVLTIELTAEFVKNLEMNEKEREEFLKLFDVEVPKTLPLKISCPLCRSTVMEIKTEENWREIQLSQANGETKKCKDRRHPCKIECINGSICVEVLMEDDEQKQPSERVLDLDATES